MNDKGGHLAGDKYLLDFSEALKKSAAGTGFLARIGGDEFVLVLKDEAIELVDSICKKIKEELDRMNAADNSYVRSAAAGYAFRHEQEDGDYRQIYLLADERMYKNKAAMKQSR